MPNMNLVKTLLATTFALTAATATFAASEKSDSTDKVVVSTQEQPSAVGQESAAGQPTAGQPTNESAAEESTPAPGSTPNQ